MGYGSGRGSGEVMRNEEERKQARKEGRRREGKVGRRKKTKEEWRRKVRRKERNMRRKKWMAAECCPELNKQKTRVCNY